MKPFKYLKLKKEKNSESKSERLSVVSYYLRPQGL